MFYDNNFLRAKFVKLKLVYDSLYHITFFRKRTYHMLTTLKFFKVKHNLFLIYADWCVHPTSCG